MSKRTNPDFANYYVRDAQGNALATYALKKDSLYLIEQNLYGSSRLGLKNLAILAQIDTQRQQLSDTLRIFEERVGAKNYELSNHLGNVLATIGDKTIFNTDHYNGIVYSAQLYYPFGWEIPTLSFAAKKYRFGFNGKEDDREWHAQDYGFRLYTPREGRFIGVDPITAQYPELTPYQFASNSPIAGVDLDGLEIFIVNVPIITTSPVIMMSNAGTLPMPSSVMSMPQMGNLSGLGQAMTIGASRAPIPLLPFPDHVSDNAPNSTNSGANSWRPKNQYNPQDNFNPNHFQNKVDANSIYRPIIIPPGDTTSSTQREIQDDKPEEYVSIWKAPRRGQKENLLNGDLNNENHPDATFFAFKKADARVFDKHYQQGVIEFKIPKIQYDYLVKHFTIEKENYSGKNIPELRIPENNRLIKYDSY